MNMISFFKIIIIIITSGLSFSHFIQLCLIMKFLLIDEHV